MVQTFYRRRSRLKPEDWTEEIEKWEKYYMNDEYQIEKRRKDLLQELQEKERKEKWMPIKMMMEMEREEKEKELLLDCDGEYCGHKRKTEMDTMIICYECGKELGRRYGKTVGYNNRNHVMRGARKC